jgi:hypothetical protein
MDEVQNLNADQRDILSWNSYAIKIGQLYKN